MVSTRVFHFATMIRTTLGMHQLGLRASPFRAFRSEKLSEAASGVRSNHVLLRMTEASWMTMTARRAGMAARLGRQGVCSRSRRPMQSAAPSHTWWRL